MVAEKIKKPRFESWFLKRFPNFMQLTEQTDPLIQGETAFHALHSECQVLDSGPSLTLFFIQRYHSIRQ